MRPPLRPPLASVEAMSLAFDTLTKDFQHEFDERTKLLDEAIALKRRITKLEDLLRDKLKNGSDAYHARIDIAIRRILEEVSA